MNEKLRRMIMEQFPAHRDQTNILRLVDLAIESPKDVDAVTAQLIDDLKDDPAEEHDRAH